MKRARILLLAVAAGLLWVAVTVKVVAPNPPLPGVTPAVTPGPCPTRGVRC
jgi:hypothetical protein